MPLGRAKIADRYPVGQAMSGEQARQRLAGVEQLYAGAGDFRTGMRAVEQMYAPVRFRIGPGGGANTAGSISGSPTTAAQEYEGKRPSMMQRRKGSRSG